MANTAHIYIEKGDNLTTILSGVVLFTKHDATGLLQAKVDLAGAAMDAEKYIL